MTPGATMNLISRNKFPVPTYNLGKKRVIDLAVQRAFFEAKKAEGLSLSSRSRSTASKPPSSPPRRRISSAAWI